MMLKGLTQAEVDAFEAERLADSIRAERDRLLSACDWTQLPDAPVDASAWKKYRKGLRDVTKKKGFPESVIWPIQPEVLP